MEKTVEDKFDNKRRNNQWVLLPLDIKGIRNEDVVDVCVCLLVQVCVRCDFVWRVRLPLPCQHSEHKGRSKQKGRDVSDPGRPVLTAIIQPTSIMCANNVIIHYLEHDGVDKSISRQNA